MVYDPSADGSAADAATNVSPFLRRPLRTAEQAARECDDSIVVGLLMSLDVLCARVKERQVCARSERGRLACDRVVQQLEQLRRDLIVGGPL
jgi:hypothetical protein